MLAVVVFIILFAVLGPWTRLDRLLKRRRHRTEAAPEAVPLPDSDIAARLVVRGAGARAEDSRPSSPQDGDGPVAIKKAP